MKKILLLVSVFSFLPLFSFAAVNTPPKILLIGDTVLTFTEGDVFIDPGYKIKDKEEPAQNLVTSVSTIGIDMANSGTYFVTYRATDSLGLFVEATRTIVVEEPEVVIDPLLIGEINLSVSSEDPESSTIEVDTNSATSNMNIGVFKIAEEGGIDVTIDELKVTLATSDDTIVDVVDTVSLFVDGVEIDSQSVTGELIIFSALELIIPANSMTDVEIVVNFKATDDGFAYAQGTTIQVTDVELLSMVDLNGNDESIIFDGGSYAGETHTLYSEGIMVELTEESASIVFTADDAGESDLGQFEFQFEVTAFGDDMFVDKSCQMGGVDTPGQGIRYNFSNPDNLDISVCNTNSLSGAEEEAYVYRINEGDTEEFSITITTTVQEPGFQKVFLESINFGQINGDTNDNYYTSLEEFETSNLFLNVL